MLFNVILFWLTVVTAVFWLVDRLVLARLRRGKEGDAAKPNPFVDFFASLFPVIFAVFLVRSFVVEPFRIPSGSMIPTLHIGDFVLVNKFEYGLRCPIGTCKLINVGEPHRGDVVVFLYPGTGPDDPNRGEDFIKRVIGVPGDHIQYVDKQLTVNGKPVALTDDGPYLGSSVYDRYTEKLPSDPHSILLNPEAPPHDADVIVPPHEYFVMGDNRDNSYDSRFWGFVPEANLRGRAFLIWMSWNFNNFRPDFSRIGMIIH